jgi:threonine 3-dehydrogenase
MLFGGLRSSAKPQRILITGGGGQLGPEFASHLRGIFSKDSVICTSLDLRGSWATKGPSEYLDVCNLNDFMRVAANNRVTTIIHFAALLSASSERNPALAMQVNSRGVENAFAVADALKLKIFVPSSIAAFGPSTPRTNTPDVTVQRPSFLYGVGKVYAELLGDWYHKAKGVDFRSLRYPGVISWKEPPGGGTTDWACDSYFKAVEGKPFECFVEKDTRMPMMHVDDVVRGTAEFLTVDSDKLTQRIYNMSGCAFTPEEQVASIKKKIPGFKAVYKPDFRQQIALSWPESLDDSKAAQDWGWKPKFNLDAITDDMLRNIQKKD